MDAEINRLLKLNEREVQKKNQKDETSQIENSTLKKILEGEDSELGNHLLKNKSNFENAQDREEKSMYREKYAMTYWEFYQALAKKLQGNMSIEKRLLLRFHLLDSQKISSRQFRMLSSIPLHEKDERIYFMDEWLTEIAESRIEPSIMDESIMRKFSSLVHEKLERKQSQIQAEQELLSRKSDQLEYEIERLKTTTSQIHPIKEPMSLGESEKEIMNPLDSGQREILNQISENTKSVFKLDRELSSVFRNLDRLKKEMEQLKQKSDEQETGSATEITNELQCLKQMIKMTVGKQGNHFPVLMESYFTDEVNQIAIKKNIRDFLKEIEFIDPSLFVRTYKGQEYQVAPYMILLPCYGDSGICWEAIPRNNRAMGPGRLGIPIFPKNLKASLLKSLADLRWQVAKEKAHQYWMEEGLTGDYYEYYIQEKLKGDIRRYFIQDYIQWIEWESKGIQKLHKDVRSIFWRKIPFPQETKEKLKNQGFYYSDLYQKDQRRKESSSY